MFSLLGSGKTLIGNEMCQWKYKTFFLFVLWQIWSIIFVPYMLTHRPCCKYTHFLQNQLKPQVRNVWAVIAQTVYGKVKKKNTLKLRSDERLLFCWQHPLMCTAGNSTLSKTARRRLQTSQRFCIIIFVLIICLNFICLGRGDCTGNVLYCEVKNNSTCFSFF